MKLTTLLVGASALLIAGSAQATTFVSTFENVAGGPSYGGYTTVSTADGWASTNGIELQNHVAGNPAATGGDVFVELDTNANSSIFRTLDAGTYSVNFLYSARPNFPAETNGIEVLLNGTSLFTIAALGGSDTAWNNFSITPFAAAANSILTFRAIGTSDGVGGYIDNISVTGVAGAVPEVATWAMMLAGFGMIGFAARRRSNVKTTVKFA